MPRSVILDELHMTFRIPHNLNPQIVRSIEHVLARRSFLARVRAAVRALMAEEHALNMVSIRLSR